MRPADSHASRDMRDPTSPAPLNFSFHFRAPDSNVFDQDLLNICLADATRFNRVWWKIARLRMEERPMNKLKPASIHAMWRLNWMGPDADNYRTFYCRTTSYTDPYFPRRAYGLACDVMIGHILTGALERPHSDWNPTALPSCGFGPLKDWQHFAPYNVMCARLQSRSIGGF